MGIIDNINNSAPAKMIMEGVDAVLKPIYGAEKNGINFMHGDELKEKMAERLQGTVSTAKNGVDAAPGKMGLDPMANVNRMTGPQ